SMFIGYYYNLLTLYCQVSMYDYGILSSPILRAQRRELHKYPHQYGDNFGGWFQMGESGLYSINLYIKDDSGKTWKVNFDYMLQ
ncbi:MAG: hypothetical protein P3W89_007870, partial [Aquificaceae bacterium]|nr:hypothetical protein [Aquificaceae bacterium]